LPGMFLAYHLLTKPYTAKNEGSGVVGCLLGLFVETVQNLLVISAAPTTWPPVMIGMATYASVVTLNLEALGLACIGSMGNTGVVARYFCQTLVFPSMVGHLAFGIFLLGYIDQLGWSCWCIFSASLTRRSNKVVAARSFDKNREEWHVTANRYPCFQACLPAITIGLQTLCQPTPTYPSCPQQIVCMRLPSRNTGA